ncbi:MAG: DegT/DnrJ/EryC1/StrS family aminotransferase, partial [Actinobacteria bacterium]|nr:DegT/DnrJ/EryC1/StrS family aminotransferase [Actinomycetota bacterium]
ATQGERIPFAKTYICPEAREEVARVLASGWVTTGPEVTGFERDFAAWLSVDHAVAVSSCTAAIELALRALKLRPGAKVLTSTMTFCGAVNAIIHAGLMPVLVDVNADTLMPDEATIADAARRAGSVDAMVVVHFGGHPAPVEEMAQAANLPLERVVEDAAHAIGTWVGEKPVGTISAATCFSFYATKNLPIGEGGMVTTGDSDLADAVRRNRLHGMSRDAWKRYLPGSGWRYEIHEPGLKANMTDVQAAIGRAQLLHLPEWQEKREGLVSRYDEMLAGVEGIETPPSPSSGRHAWHLYVVQVKPEFGPDRDAVMAALAERGVDCSVHFIPVHHQPYWRRLTESGIAASFPATGSTADQVFPQIISLPLYPSLTTGEVDRVSHELASLRSPTVRQAHQGNGSAQHDDRADQQSVDSNGGQADAVSVSYRDLTVTVDERFDGSSAKQARERDRKRWRARAQGNGKANSHAAPIRQVLIIGGAGYVGSVLVRKLLDRGYVVRVLDALMYGDEGIKDVLGRPGFDVVEADLRSLDSIMAASRHADAIVHLGGLVGDPACALDERLTLEINLESTRMLTKAARELGVQRFVFASSCSVYGASEEVAAEDSALEPVSLYARTKVESEQILLENHDNGFIPVALRFGSFYGLSPRPRFDLVVNLLAAKAIADGEITIFGGDQWRPFLHVEDGAEAIIRCLEVPQELVRGEIFNVGSDDHNYSLGGIGQLIAELIPGVQLSYQSQSSEEADYRVSFDKIRRVLNFTPSRSVWDGVLEIKAAIERGAVSDYHESRYSNYKALATGNAGESLRRLDGQSSIDDVETIEDDAESPSIVQSDGILPAPELDTPALDGPVVVDEMAVGQE